MAQTVGIEDIRKAISNSLPVVVKTYTLPHDTELYLEEVLGKFLKEIGYEKLMNPLSYCLKELAVNAKKANTKRVYFIEKGFNIGSDADYEKGMRSFKTDTLDNIQHYLAKQKEKGLYIKIVFQTKNKALAISIHNNVEITKKEHMRVYDRIARARMYNHIADAFASSLDDSEGAGLGIIILILMLKKIGLSEDSFELDVEGGETIAKISIPFSNVHLETLDILTEAIVREIDTLPHFPENIVYLQKLTGDPESNISEIARIISSDPVLVAELLKLVNSPIYRVSKKIESVAQAIKLIGMRALRNILYSYGTQVILGTKYKMMKDLWDHSNKVASYAHAIARNYGSKPDVLDDVFVGGILHDFGKIILASLHPNVLDRIKKFCMEKGIAAQLLEDMSMGLNHAAAGAKIAEKWNFPDQLVYAIRAHHEPSLSPEEYRNVVYPVYLANFICDYEKEKVVFDQIDAQVREYFRILSEEQLLSLIERLRRQFDNDKHFKPGEGQ
jgi:putative nucleotidyltransferase with HDIG domain